MSSQCSLQNLEFLNQLVTTSSYLDLVIICKPDRNILSLTGISDAEVSGSSKLF